MQYENGLVHRSNSYTLEKRTIHPLNNTAVERRVIDMIGLALFT